MVEEMMQNSSVGKKRRRFGDNKHGKGKKKNFKTSNTVVEYDNRKKMDPRMRKMLKRKARNYNSDSDEGEDSGNEKVEEVVEKKDEVRVDEEFEKSGGRKFGVYDKTEEEVFEEEEDREDGEDDDGGEEEDVSEDESGVLQPGIMRFTDGCKVFQGAFRKIIVKKTATEDVLGPVLSGNKRLVAEKLAENDEELKVKKEAKKEKLLIHERGHVKPDTYLDAHEKLLISIATKGVVKLFNAVNKAQQSQRGLNPLRSKDQKAIKNRRKEVFFTELGKKSSVSGSMTSKVGTTEAGSPSWAPLRDDFMLTKSKLKDWEKNTDTRAGDDLMSSDSAGSSSGEE